MKRSLILLLSLVFALILVVNGTKRLLSFRTTSQKVDEAQQRLEQLKKENEALRQDLEYKKSDQFAEGEIRDKLGLTKPGEAIVVLPQEQKAQANSDQQISNTSNFQKWRTLFFGG